MPKLTPQMREQVDRMAREEYMRNNPPPATLPDPPAKSEHDLQRAAADLCRALTRLVDQITAEMQPSE